MQPIFADETNDVQVGGHVSKYKSISYGNARHSLD